MRFKILFAALTACFAFYLIADPSIGESQQPPFGKGQPDPNAGGGFGKKGKGGAAADPNAPTGGKKGGKGGGFGGQQDPNTVFDAWYGGKGKDAIVIADLKFPAPQDLTFWLDQNAIKDGKVTRDQFAKYWAAKPELQQQMREAGIGKGGKKGKGGPPDAGGTDKGGGFDFAGKKGGKKKDYDEDRAAQEFARYDTNKDGKLDEKEIENVGRPFKDVWTKFDANKNSTIELDEWKEYKKARAVGLDGFMGKGDATTKKDGPGFGTVDIAEDFSRPVVWALGKLPAGMPDWFAKIDQYPADGQISLYEWRKAGKTEAEFIALDKNEDGYLTIEEIYRQFVKTPPRKVEVASATPTKGGEDDPDDGDEETEGGIVREPLPMRTPVVTKTETPVDKGEATGKKGKKGKKGMN